MAFLGACATEDQGNGDEPSGANNSQPEEQQEAAADTSEVLDLGHLGHDLGSPDDADILVIEFSDFGCVHCQGFHQETFPVLYEEFVEPGDVAWKYIPVTVGGFPNVSEVTEVVECAANQGAFFDLKDRLYQDPDAWGQAEDPQSVVLDWGAEEGLDVEALETCITEGAASDRVEEQTSTARELGLQATPTFVINGQPVQGAPTLDAFRDFFQEQLEGPPSAPDG